MSDTDIEDKPATSLAEVDVHIRYLRRDLRLLLQSVQQMATKADIDQIARRLESFATKDELARTAAEVARLAADVQSGSVGSTFERWLALVTKIGSAAAVLAAFGAAMAALVHFLDRVPK